MVIHQIPKSLIEALTLIENDDYKIMAGGTDVMVQYRNHEGTLPKILKPVLFLNQIEELKYIKVSNQSLLIGAMTPMDEIMADVTVPVILRETIEEIAAPGIRHLATLGGNIVNASPAADAVCTLIALDASVKLQSTKQTRIIKIDDFIIGPKKTNILPNELVTEIIIPLKKTSYARFFKVGGRKADAISKVSVAAIIDVSSGLIEHWRLAFGAVGPTVVHHSDMDHQWIGLSVESMKQDPDKVLGCYSPIIKPIDDQRSTALYRKTVALNLVKQVIQDL